MSPATGPQVRVAAVRAFNRFYTRQIGLLNSGYLQSPLSLTEVRVLYELSHRDGPSAAELSKELGVDPGYLSRIMLGFKKSGFLVRKTSRNDARQRHLHLTKRGRKSFAALESRSQREIETMLGGLRASEQGRLVEAMRTIQDVLDGKTNRKPSYVLRPHQPGDMGWVIHRHGVLYSKECGWDERFEALVAEIAAKFIQHFNPSRERCWIAEMDGAIVGSVFLVRETNMVARLRLLLVEPSTRGLGIGHRLVEECTRFARRAGYRKITLWTQSNLRAARHIYKNAGYRLVKKERHSEFGYELVGESWDLVL